MGRRRRKKARKIIRVKRTLPKVFQCPNCGIRAMTIEFVEKGQPGSSREAIVKCGQCKLYAKIEVPYAFHEVDAYSRFLDLFHEGKVEYTFMEEEEEREEIGEEESFKLSTEKEE